VYLCLSPLQHVPSVLRIPSGLVFYMCARMSAPADDAGLHLCVCVFPDCREEKFPCTRLYSVHKPVKQCISYLCVTSVRRMYIINKEVCSRIVCKENEVMQDEICRQLAGLPSRRLRRSGQPLHLPCRQLLEQQRRPDAL
uniref:Microfibril associated protein 5 n=1 Tax=Strix occidentalis caurina TaxID=311401 RepID=A0A8D0FAY1_STROC